SRPTWVKISCFNSSGFTSSHKANGSASSATNAVTGTASPPTTRAHEVTHTGGTSAATTAAATTTKGVPATPHTRRFTGSTTRAGFIPVRVASSTSRMNSQNPPTSQATTAFSTPVPTWRHFCITDVSLTPVRSLRCDRGTDPVHSRGLRDAMCGCITKQFGRCWYSRDALRAHFHIVFTKGFHTFWLSRLCHLAMTWMLAPASCSGDPSMSISKSKLWCRCVRGSARHASGLPMPPQGRRRLSSRHSVAPVEKLSLREDLLGPRRLRLDHGRLDAFDDRQPEKADRNHRKNHLPLSLHSSPPCGTQ